MTLNDETKEIKTDLDGLETLTEGSDLQKITRDREVNDSVEEVSTLTLEEELEADFLAGEKPGDDEDSVSFEDLSNDLLQAESDGDTSEEVIPSQAEDVFGTEVEDEKTTKTKPSFLSKLNFPKFPKGKKNAPEGVEEEPESTFDDYPELLDNEEEIITDDLIIDEELGVESEETQPVVADPSSELVRRIDPSLVKAIREQLMVSHSQMIIDSLDDLSVRIELTQIVKDEFKIKKDSDLEYVITEIVGTGFIERLLKRPDITDIGWNGSFLVVETPYSRIVYDKEELDIDDIEAYINRLVAKYANAVGKSFNDSYPILDAAYNNVRLNAVHKSLAPDGTTISLRVVRNSLAITEENFDFCFAPMFVLEFLKTIMRSGANLVISGITGTGKTEIQKLAFSYVNPNEKIITIEDVREMHLKELYPEKDILSWVTSVKTTIADEVKASLRNNPRWVVVSETRGAEAYEMYQGLITGQNVVTTLHAENASKIPRRFVSMIMSAYDVDETMLTYDILSSFNFGFHIKRVNYRGVTLRFLEEIIEFSPEGNTTLFKQTFEHGKFYITTGAQVSEEFRAKMAEAGTQDFVFPENNHVQIEKQILNRIPQYTKETENKRAEIISLLEDLNA